MDKEEELRKMERMVEEMAVELKANRRSIARLSEQSHGDNDKLTMQVKISTEENESLKEKNNKLEITIDNLNNKLQNLMQELEVSENSRQEIHKRLEEIISKKNQNKEEVLSYKKEIAILKKSIEIKDRKIEETKQELEDNKELYQIMKVKRSEMDLLNETNIEQAKNIKQLGFEKKQHEAFLEKLLQITSLNENMEEVELEVKLKVLSSRLRELVRQEGGALIEKQSHVYSLQRKIKSLNEQLNSKNLYLDLMRKKLENVNSDGSLPRKMSAGINGNNTKNIRISSSYQTRMEEKHKEKDKVQKLMRLLEQHKEDMKMTETENEALKKKLRRESDLEKQFDDLQLEFQMVREENDKLNIENTKINRFNEDKDGKMKKLHNELKSRDMKLEKLEKALTMDVELKKQLSFLLMGTYIKQNNSVATIGIGKNDRFVLEDDQLIEAVHLLLKQVKQQANTVFALDSAVSNMASAFKQGYEKAVQSVGSDASTLSTTFSRLDSSFKKTPINLP